MASRGDLTSIAGKIDSQLLAPELSAPQLHRGVTDAMQSGFAGVCVAPVWIARVATMLRGSGVRVCAAIAFPHGTSKSTIKAIEATSSIKDGAEEVEVVAHLPHLMSVDVDSARYELMEIVRAARSTRRDVFIKVIVETAALLALDQEKSEASIVAACRAVRESGCDGIVTSTGFHRAGGASANAVALLKKYGEGLLVKAAGGMHDRATIDSMLSIGADRVGIEELVISQSISAKVDLPI